MSQKLCCIDFPRIFLWLPWNLQSRYAKFPWDWDSHILVFFVADWAFYKRISVILLNLRFSFCLLNILYFYHYYMQYILISISTIKTNVSYFLHDFKGLCVISTSFNQQILTEESDGKMEIILTFLSYLFQLGSYQLM